jgi:hypothetical protein
MQPLDWQDRLLTRWRASARAERDRGREDVAAIWERAAADLEAAVTDWERTPLDLTAAARESGYSVPGLWKMIRRGDLRNVGRDRFPRVLRGDLPRKARRTLLKDDDDGEA